MKAGNQASLLSGVNRTFVVLCVSLFVSAVWQVCAAAVEDVRWSKAEEAYRMGNDANGHALMKAILDDNPGNPEIASKCLERILVKAGRRGGESSWVQFAVRRLTALERLGGVSANTKLARDAFDGDLELRRRQGRLLEVVEERNRMAEENKHDPHWRIRRARAYQQLNSSGARALLKELSAEADPEHPDSEIREQWQFFARVMEVGLDELPLEPEPLPGADVLQQMEPDDPDGLWGDLRGRSVDQVVHKIDRLAGMTWVEDQVVPWRDLSGWTDSARALDLYLLGRKSAELQPLRNLQEDGFLLETRGEEPGKEERLGLFRRYPWSKSAQALMLVQAGDYLWQGRTHSALRSFKDVMFHSVDSELKQKSRVGFWLCLRELGLYEELESVMKTEGFEKVVPYMGRNVTVGELRDELIRGRKVPANIVPPLLSEVTTHVVRMPPVVAGFGESSSAVALVSLRVEGDKLLLSGPNVLASYEAANPGAPLWMQMNRHPIEERPTRGVHAGRFRPIVENGTIFSRWGFESLPDSVAAFDMGSGQPRWTARFQPDTGNRHAVPVGDPVLADGRLFCLRWNTRHDIHNPRERSLSLACVDVAKKSLEWNAIVLESGKASDLSGEFEQAQASLAICGNRVTVNRGAIYANSNAGLISRSDVRDGRTDWVHYYRNEKNSRDQRRLGAAPIIWKDLVICMPRDGGGRIFALSQRTGRLVWDNALLSVNEVLGLSDGRVIVLGRGQLLALDAMTGDASWAWPIKGGNVGGAQLIGDHVYVSQEASLQRIEVQSGRVVEEQAWRLGEERPLEFVVDGRRLYVVTDRPADHGDFPIGQPLNPHGGKASGSLRLPLQTTWNLQRGDARVAIPPSGSKSNRVAFVLSGGILECIDLSAKGGIRWRRIVRASGAPFLVSDQLLLLTDRSDVLGELNHRIVAYHASDGRVAWNSVLPRSLGQSLECGSFLLFHDGHGQILAVDRQSGRTLWERYLGEGQSMKLRWDGEYLYVFHASMDKAARYLRLSAKDGVTLDDEGIEMSYVKGLATYGRPMPDGTFRIEFPAVKGRYLRLVCLSEVNGMGWSSVAELHATDADGMNISRKGWKASADCYETRSTRYTPSPAKAIDGDPDSWWHSEWIDQVPRHPHEIVIDMGSEKMVAGLNYLPAVIVNNNGMIRDYEFYVSESEKEWGEPVAEGVMVNRVRVDRAEFVGGSIFLQARNFKTQRSALFRYDPGSGRKARLVVDGARLDSVQGQYLLALARDEHGQEDLLVLKPGDPNYQFRIASEVRRHFQGSPLIDGNRLISAERRIALVDLDRKEFLIRPGDKERPSDRHGAVVRLGPGRLLKLVNRGREGQELTEIDLQTGELSRARFDGYFEGFRANHYQLAPSQRIPEFEDVLLLYDGTTFSALVGVGSEN